MVWLRSLLVDAVQLFISVLNHHEPHRFCSQGAHFHGCSRFAFPHNNAFGHLTLIILYRYDKHEKKWLYIVLSQQKNNKKNTFVLQSGLRAFLWLTEQLLAPQCIILSNVWQFNILDLRFDLEFRSSFGSTVCTELVFSPAQPDISSSIARLRGSETNCLVYAFNPVLLLVNFFKSWILLPLHFFK